MTSLPGVIILRVTGLSDPTNTAPTQVLTLLIPNGPDKSMTSKPQNCFTFSTTAPSPSFMHYLPSCDWLGLQLKESNAYFKLPLDKLLSYPEREHNVRVNCIPKNDKPINSPNKPPQMPGSTKGQGLLGQQLRNVETASQLSSLNKISPLLTLNIVYLPSMTPILLLNINSIQFQKSSADFADYQLYVSVKAPFIVAGKAASTNPDASHQTTPIKLDQQKFKVAWNQGIAILSPQVGNSRWVFPQMTDIVHLTVYDRNPLTTDKIIGELSIQFGKLVVLANKGISGLEGKEAQDWDIDLKGDKEKKFGKLRVGAEWK